MKWKMTNIAFQMERISWRNLDFIPDASRLGCWDWFSCRAEVPPMQGASQTDHGPEHLIELCFVHDQLQ